MRKRFWMAIACIAIAAAGYYAASPLIAAYKLREAVRAGDSATIGAMIDWPAFRDSVRRTVARNANLLPIAEQAARRASTSWWQRLRSAFGHSMLDRFVERYITPKGLTELYRTRNSWHERTRPRTRPVQQTEVIAAGIIPTRLSQAWRRVKRAEFTSPFQFVLEIEDRHAATRLITSTFRLSDIGLRGPSWKLTAVAIRNVNPHLARLNGF